MFHSRIAKAGELHRASIGGEAIHPAWCPCDDCHGAAERRGLRLDLRAIALGIGAALIAVGLLLQRPF